MEEEARAAHRDPPAERAWNGGCSPPTSTPPAVNRRELWCDASSSARHPRISHEDLDAGRQHPRMEGREVFRNTVARMPEAVEEALSDAVGEGRLERGDLLCLVAFGSGFTWGSALVRW